jgi:ligand-binding SRPBCC domain-containing protein
MRPFRGLPTRVHWLVRISDFEWNSRFRDEQVKGPFALWRHTHNIVSETQNGINGTRVTDELEYALPLGPLGAIANAIFVRRQIETTFRFRHQRLEEILPVAARQAARRS